MSPTTTTTKIRLGTSSPSTQSSTPSTLLQLSHLARLAASKHIDILLLPEAYIGGYPRGTTFGCLMGSRTAAGRDEYLAYFQNAVDLGDTVGDGAGAGERWVRREIPGQGEGKERGDGTREELERIAKETGVFIVAGVIEKAGGSMYCAVVYVCPERGVVGKRRKVMPTGIERLVWAQGSPATLRAVTTTIRGVRVNLAAAICWENYMPLVRQSLYAQNINLYLAPTADGRDTWLPLMRTAAIEGRCFVVTSNMCVREPTPAPSGGSTTTAVAATGTATRMTARPPATEDDSAVHFSEPSGSTSPTTQPKTNRRSSCVPTEEGFEIALPASPSVSASPSRARQPQRSTRRRESVFDEDGNEIVLPCCDKSQDRGQSEGTSPFAKRVGGLNGHGAGTRGRQGGEEASGGAPEKFVSRGGSAIVNPFGEVIAGPQWEDDEGILYADVDFEDCIRGRLDLDTAGSYSRNDSFKLSVEGLDLTPLPY